MKQPLDLDSLDPDERTVLTYFEEYHSCGSLRAEGDLNSKGVRNPAAMLRFLERKGVLSFVPASPEGGSWNLNPAYMKDVKDQGVGGFLDEVLRDKYRDLGLDDSDVSQPPAPTSKGPPSSPPPSGALTGRPPGESGKGCRLEVSR